MSENSDISEAGFEEDLLDSAAKDDISKAQPVDTPSIKPKKAEKVEKVKKVEVKKAPLVNTEGSKKAGLIAIFAAVLCVPVVWAIFSLNQKSDGSDLDTLLSSGTGNEPNPLFESSLNAPEPELASNQEAVSPITVKSEADFNYGGNEFDKQEGLPLSEPSIDGSIAQLLSNYPTKAELNGKISELKGADVSDAELDVFLLTVSRNAEDIKALFANENSEDLKSMVQDLLSQLEQEKTKTAMLENSIAEYKKTLSDFKKNQGWFINRLNKLEGKTQAVSSKTPRSTKTRSLSVVTVRDHAIKGIADKVVYLKINNRGKPVRATVGFDIPGCGPITSIDAIKRHVITSSCIIK